MSTIGEYTLSSTSMKPTPPPSSFLSTLTSHPPRQTFPEVTTEIITIIVRFAQALEGAKHTEAIVTNPWHYETPSDTLVRIRTILKLGLVSKAWQGAISDPSLWTTFLNASMSDGQFLNVASRAGDLPVEIQFKPQAYHGGDDIGDENSPRWSEKLIDAIYAKVPQMTTLLINPSNLSDLSPAVDLNLKVLASAIFEPAPNLHTFSLSSSPGTYADLTRPEFIGKLFGGVRPSIRHLEIMDHIIPPRAFSLTALVSLSVGFNDARLLENALTPWLTLALHGEIPGLRDLTVRGSSNGAWDLHPQNVVDVPNTVSVLKVIGSLGAATFITSVLKIPREVEVEIRVIYQSTDRMPSHSPLFHKFNALWLYTIPEEVTVTIYECMISLRINTPRSATLAFVPASPDDSAPMIRSAAHGLTAISSKLGEILFTPRFCEATWLTLDVSILERDLRTLPGDVTVLSLAESFRAIFNGLRNIHNLHIVRYNVILEDPGRKNHWVDYFGLFEPCGTGDGEELFFPHLQRIRVTHPQNGLSKGFKRTVASYVWERSLTEERVSHAEA